MPCPGSLNSALSISSVWMSRSQYWYPDACRIGRAGTCFWSDRNSLPVCSAQEVLRTRQHRRRGHPRLHGRPRHEDPSPAQPVSSRQLPGRCCGMRARRGTGVPVFRGVGRPAPCCCPDRGTRRKWVRRRSRPGRAPRGALGPTRRRRCGQAHPVCRLPPRCRPSCPSPGTCPTQRHTACPRPRSATPIRESCQVWPAGFRLALWLAPQ